MLKKLSAFVKASKFFPKYARNVQNYSRKVQGKSSRGSKLDITTEDRQDIAAGLDKMVSDIKKELNI